MLFNGNSGWARDAGGIGICHAELRTALASASNRVSLIEERGFSSSKTSCFADSLPARDYFGRQLRMAMMRLKNARTHFRSP